ncbi:MAG TPA: hypothetical protein ACFYEF_01280 [Candidatus Wunengus sp. YC63]|uniref:hypothetical protein n=1 Tax=unclassified Candidatus Wunengus TaxID=3367695 RepID=UPI00402727C0
MKSLKKLFRRLLKSQKGMSLIETAGVIAITATIAAVVTPVALDKIGDAKVQAAKEDCSQIKNAITSFYSGTGNYPAFSSAGSSTTYAILRSGDVSQFSESISTSNKDPLIGVSGDSEGWNDSGNKIDLMRNHLVYDNAGTNAEPVSGVHPYATAKVTWKGPYIATTDKQDPWGHNYLAFVEGAYSARTTVDGKKNFGWILSAGPNGKIETPVTALTVAGDDVGVVIGSKESGGYSGTQQ